MKTLTKTLAVLLVSLSSVAYGVPITAIGSNVYSGNQAYNGYLGADFDVLSPIEVTSLGVFDDNGDGIFGTLIAMIFDRTNTVTPLATLSFTNALPGTLIGGDRFISLSTPLQLAEGFHGRIVAQGFSVNDLNGNQNIGGYQAPTLNTGGLIFFGTFSTHPATYGSFYPTTTVGVTKAADQWNAGTFQFQAAAVPEPSSLALLGLGLAGLGFGRRRKLN